MQQIIQLNPGDDITAIRACVETADLSHVVLVIPRGCTALQTDHGLQLLRRVAEDTGIEIALVAHDYETRDRAVAFGFPLFNSISQAQLARWHMEGLDPETVQGAPRRAGLGGAGVNTYLDVRQWVGLIVAVVAVSFVICMFGILFVPAANVRIIPASTRYEVTTAMLADPSITQINSETLSIPARKLTREVSGTMQIKTTTEKSVPNAPSTGIVVFSNLRAQETLVPQGTIVMTSAGVPIRFTTTTTATIPAGLNSRVEAPIQALDPGPTGNVKELQINAIEGSLSLEARVINTKATASGTNRPVKVVTADDKKRLETQLLQQMRQQGAAELQKDVKANEFLPAESVLLDVDNEIYDHVVDEPADALNMRITATVFGIAVDRDNARGLVSGLLKKQIQSDYQLLPNGIQADTLPGAKYQGIALRMQVKGVGYATPQIDSGKLARALQGKTGEEADAYLTSTIKLAQPPEIKMTPMGWNRMPWMGFRIAIFIEPQVAPTR